MLVPTMDTYQQADFVLSKVEQLYDQGIDYDQIAILYRAHFASAERGFLFGMKASDKSYEEIFLPG